MLLAGVNPYLAAAVGVLAFFVVIACRSQKTRLPDLPWINRRKGELFGVSRARYRSTFNFRDALKYAYETYSKNEKACIMPSFIGDQIVLPPSTVNWIINQKDDVLNANETQIHELQIRFTFNTPYIVENSTHFPIIVGDLTRQLSTLTADIMDELGSSFDDVWGMNSNDWTEVCVFETLMKIIARTSNRVFVGKPLCRNETLLKNGAGFAQDVPISASILRLFPYSLRPFVAPLLTFSNRRHTKAFTALLKPEINRRLKLREQRLAETGEQASEPEPNDFLQWTIKHAFANDNPRERDPNIMAERILMLNFAAIHTSTLSITNVIFDLLSHDPEYIEQLRKEMTDSLAAENGVWTKQGLAKLYKLDSTLRESTRLNSFLGTGLHRLVVAREGVTAPDGTHCPYGSMIAVPTWGVHHDDGVYANSNEFQPFRFAELREKACTEEPGDYLKQANNAFVRTNVDFHAFGHGRHACPGRFFAANELKLLLVYMLLHYDFEMIEHRPSNVWFGPVLVPPMQAKIKMKRRQT